MFTVLLSLKTASQGGDQNGYRIAIPRRTGVLPPGPSGGSTSKDDPFHNFSKEPEGSRWDEPISPHGRGQCPDAQHEQNTLKKDSEMKFTLQSFFGEISDLLFNAFGAMSEGDRATTARNTEEARNSLLSCASEMADVSSDVHSIATLFIKNCEGLVACLSGDGPDHHDAVMTTLNRMHLLCRGIANAMGDGDLASFFKVAMGTVPFIWRANDVISDADDFLRETEGTRRDSIGWLCSYTGGAIGDNYDAVFNSLLQHVSPEKDDETPEHLLIKGAVNMSNVALDLHTGDVDMADDDRMNALELVLKATAAQLSALESLASPEGDLNTPIDGVMPLEFYSWDFICKQCRTMAA